MFEKAVAFPPLSLCVVSMCLSQSWDRQIAHWNPNYAYLFLLNWCHHRNSKVPFNKEERTSHLSYLSPKSDMDQQSEQQPRRLQKLLRLSLTRCSGLRDGTTETIATATSKSKSLPLLQDLNLSESHVSDKGLAHLSPVSQLQVLSLARCGNITDAGIALLHQASPTAAGQLQDLKINALEGYHRQSHYTSADTTKKIVNNIDDESHISSYFLWDYENRGISGGVKHVKRTYAPPVYHFGHQLRELNLSGCHRLTDESLSYLKKHRNLTTVNVSGCLRLTAAGIASLKNLRHLNHLDMSGCALITDSALEHLTDITSLRTLNLSGCNITDDSLSGTVKRNTHLKTLNLSWCRKITDAGVEHLKGLSQLHSLHVFNCRLITDAGVEHMQSLVNLRELNISWCRLVTDRGVARLNELKDLQTIMR